MRTAEIRTFDGKTYQVTDDDTVGIYKTFTDHLDRWHVDGEYHGRLKVGDTVLYRLDETDATVIKQERHKRHHRGNPPYAGEYYPAVVVRPWGPRKANLHLLLDGTDTYWVAGREHGDGEGQWMWPSDTPAPAGGYEPDGPEPAKYSDEAAPEPFDDGEPDTFNPNDPSVQVDLRESGLLWLINRIVFHPRGFALGVNSLGEFFLAGDGSEPWSFTDTDLEDEKFKTVELLFANSFIQGAAARAVKGDA